MRPRSSQKPPYEALRQGLRSASAAPNATQYSIGSIGGELTHRWALVHWLEGRAIAVVSWGRREKLIRVDRHLGLEIVG